MLCRSTSMINVLNPCSSVVYLATFHKIAIFTKYRIFLITLSRKERQNHLQGKCCYISNSKYSGYACSELAINLKFKLSEKNGQWCSLSWASNHIIIKQRTHDWIAIFNCSVITTVFLEYKILPLLQINCNLR